MRVVLADGPLIERVLDDSFPVWHEGLSRDAYSKWSRGQLRTPWGSEHLQRFALVDGAGGHVASLKRYRHPVHVDGRDGWMCGIGAVLTVPEHRGAGHASRLVEHVIEESRREGADRDLPLLAAMHATRAKDARLALRRDAPLIRYAIAKKRLFAGLSAPGTRQLEFFVAEEGVMAVAYVVLSQNQYGWTLEEAGDRDPAGARLGAMFQVLLAREPSLRDPIVRAWWPRGFPTPPQLTLSSRSDPKDVFMVRPLAGGIEVPPGPEGVFWWRSDYF